MKLKRNDSVIITVGKDKGKTGIIEKIGKIKVIVKGLNISKKHHKPSKVSPKSGIEEKAMPIEISNVAIICGQCKKKTKVKFKLIKDKKIRVCAKCSETI